MHSFFSVIILPSATNNVKKIFKSTYAVFQSKQEERPLKQTLLFVLLVLLVSVQITCRCCSGAGWSQSLFHCKPCRYSLDAIFFSRGFSSHNAVIPSVVFFGREIESAAHITADGAVDFGTTLFLAGRLYDTLSGMVTGGVYNVVLVREAVILIALVHRVAVLCASRRDNGNGEGVLGGQDLFGHGRIAVLAMQSLDAILIIGRLGSDDTLIPDMTSTTVGVSHGMRSVTLAVHPHSAQFGAGSLFQTLGICKVPIMAADSWHRLQNSFVATLVVAVHPTLALGLTSKTP